jgi:hypothetical protein
MGFAGVMFTAASSLLLACSSGDTVVAVNVLSSNDTQYNGDTRNGSFGGLLDPGIPDNILHPDIAGAPTTLRKATKLRITISQSASVTVTGDIVPVAISFDVDVLDAAGMPVLDDMQKVMRAKHSGIAQSDKRFTLDSSFAGGATQVTAAAVDDSGQAFFNAVPVTIDLKKGGATAAFLDFKIPSPTPPPSPDGGAADAGDAGGAATDARADAVPAADAAPADATPAADARVDAVVGIDALSGG